MCVYHPPIYAKVSQVVSCPQVFRQVMLFSHTSQEIYHLILVHLIVKTVKAESCVWIRKA